MRKKATTMLAAFALAATATVGLVVAGPAPAANAADVGVNMHQACQIQHGIGWQAKLLDAGNAYSWRCWVPPWGVERNVNIQMYCTYFGLGQAWLLDSGNAYSWRCRS